MVTGKMAKMRYNKILEVSEDNERVYFSFYIDNSNQRIIGIPKENCLNKAMYAGTDFSSLTIVDSHKANLLLTELMKRTMLTHPATQLCNQEALKLIEY
jgi:DNA relaxase NicK